MNKFFEIYNGRVIEEGTAVLPVMNRGFRYGDGIFESIRISNSAPCYLPDHLDRLYAGMKILGIPEPAKDFTMVISSAISQIIELNKLNVGRIRLVVCREASGNYKPDTLSASWSLSGTAAIIPDLTSMGKKVVLFEGQRKQPGILSNIKSLNGLIYIVAANYAATLGADDAFIQNPAGRIIETTNSNIFIRTGSRIQTPMLSEGCLDGIMRKKLLAYLAGQGYDVTETLLEQDDVLNADEILLTNAIERVRYVSDACNRKFENTLHQKIVSEDKL